MRRTKFAVLALLFVLCSRHPCWATDYYIDRNAANASDTNPGSAALPWKTISKANSTLAAGDTVFIKAGTYNTYIAPLRSGTAAARITYTAFGNDVVTISGTPYAVLLDAKSYITIQKIHGTLCRSFVYLINGANHNQIFDSTFDQSSDPANWDVSVIRGSSQFNHIRNSQFSRAGQCTAPGIAAGSDDGEVLDLGNQEDPNDRTWYNLIEGSRLFDGGHQVMGLMSGFNTVRNNYFHNEAWSNGHGNRTLYLNGPDATAGRNVIEGNRFGYAATPCDDYTVGSIAMSTRLNIFRYNYLYYSNAYALGFYSYSGYSSGSNNKVYNNTFFRNAANIDPAYKGGSQDAAVAFLLSSLTGNVFKNNLYYSHFQVYGGPRTSHSFSNEFNGDSAGNNPLFVNAPLVPPSDTTDPSAPNLSFSSNSPAIDKGRALTTVAVADTGSGTSLMVSDGTYFQDGSYAPAGTVQADWIAVGNVNNVAQISSISGNVLTLVNPMTRVDGDSVWLYKKSDGARVLFGSNPEAGAYEYGKAPAAPTNVRIVRAGGSNQ